MVSRRFPALPAATSALVIAFTLTCATLAIAQTHDASIVVAVPAASAAPLITAKVDETRLMALPAFAIPKDAQEVGPANPNLKLSMQLVLRRSEVQENALSLLNQQSLEPSSSLYGKTLTPADFAKTFGLAGSDLETLKRSLENAGFTVGNIDNGRLTIDFEGTVSQVNAAFHTEIHNYLGAEGASHFAPATALQIPKALSPAIKTINGVQNFKAEVRPGFNGPVVDFAAGTVDERVAADATGKMPELKLSGEALHDASFTASKYVLGLKGSTTLNVRIGGNNHPATGTLAIEDLDGKVVAFVGDITKCEPYNGDYGRSCTADFKPPIGTSFLKAIYSGDDNERAAVLPLTIISLAGTSGTYMNATDSPINIYSTANSNTVTAVLSYVGNGSNTTATQPTGTFTVEYSGASGTPTFGVATLPTPPALTKSCTSACGNSTAGNPYTYSCTVSPSNQTATCTITLAAAWTDAETDQSFVSIVSLEPIYSGDTNYASANSTTYEYSQYRAGTVVPTLTNSGTGTSTYGTASSYTVTSDASSTGGGVTCGSTSIPAYWLYYSASATGSVSTPPEAGTAAQGLAARCSGSSPSTTGNTAITVGLSANTPPGTYNVTTYYTGNTGVYNQTSYIVEPLASATTSTLTVGKFTPVLGSATASPNIVLTGSSTPVTITGTFSVPAVGVLPSGTLNYIVNGVSTAATCVYTSTAGSLSCSATLSGATVAGFSSGNYAITSSFAGDGYYSAASGTGGNLSVSNTGGSLTANPTGITYGAGSTVALTDALTFNSTSPTPTGTVTFTLNSGVTAIGSVGLTACSVSGNVYACTYNWTPPAGASGDNAGSYIVTAAYSGNKDANSVTTAFTINKSPTTTITSATPTTVHTGTAATTVTSVTTWTGNGVNPTGTVTLTCGTGSAGTCTGLPAALTVGGSSCPINAANKTFTCTVSYALDTDDSAYGFYNLTMTYSGDTNYGTSNGVTPVLDTANYALGTNTLSGTPTSVIYGSGSSVTYTTSLTGTSGHGSLEGATYTLTGTPVTGSPLITTINSSGSTPCTLTHNYQVVCTTAVAVPPTTPASTTAYTVVQTFNGNSNYAPGSATTSASVTVNPQTLTFGTGSVSPSPAYFGNSQAITISKVVNWTGSGNAPTAANFSFSVSPTVGAIPATCVASGNSYTCTGTISAATAATLAINTYNVVLNFTTDTNYNAVSNQTVASFNVVANATTITLGITNPGNTTTGTTGATITATIANSTSSAFAPAGTVVLTNNTTGQTYNGTISSGTVQFTAGPTSPGISAGLNNFTATYGGTTGFSGSGPSNSVTAYIQGVLVSSTLSHDFSGLINYGSSPAVTVEGTIDGTKLGPFGIVVYNFSTSAQTVGLNFSNASSGAFSYATNCPASLPANGTCNYFFYYDPPTGDGCNPSVNCTADGSGYPQGTYEAGTWQLTSSAILGVGDTGFDRSGPVAFPAALSGKAVLPTGSLISVTPLNYTFGPLAPNELSNTLTIAVTNTSSTPVGLTYTAPTTAAFQATNYCPATLAGNATCTVNVTFENSAVGTYNDSVTITPQGSTAISAALTGIVRPNTGLQLNTNVHNFGNIATGQSAGASGLSITKTQALHAARPWHQPVRDHAF